MGNKDLENFRALWVGGGGGGKSPSISSCMSCIFARLLALFVFLLLEDSNVLWSCYGSFCLLPMDCFLLSA